MKLQGGDEYCRAMWKKLVDITMAQNQLIYDRLNVSLTEKDVMGESLYNPMLRTIDPNIGLRAFRLLHGFNVGIGFFF